MNKKQLLFAVFTGILLVSAYPVMPFYMMAFVALVPLLLVFESDKMPKRKYLTVYISFFIYHAGTNWWISSWQQDTDPFLFASGFAVMIVHPFLFLIPFGIWFHLRKKLGRKLALYLFPVFWVTFEWLHSIGDLAYPWQTLGYTQIYNTAFVQIADLFGVWGVSFLIVLINVFIVDMILTINSMKSSKWFNIGKVRSIIASIMVLLAVSYIYGTIRLNEFNHDKLIIENDTVSVGIIQPSINPWSKWNTGVLGMIELHMAIQDSLVSRYGHIDLCLWSETAIPYLNYGFNFDHDFGFLQKWVNDNGSALLTGFADHYMYKPGEETSATSKPYPGSKEMYDSFNAAMMLNVSRTDSIPAQIYHKMKLTPMGESIPFVEVFTFAKDWLEWGVGISGWKKGEVQHNLRLRNDGINTEFGSIICIESIFPGFCKGFTEQGAGFLVVITNDAWYDYTPGPEQHYLIAAMRAIENRRYIPRCANTGVSGIITATGSSLMRLPEYKGIGAAGTIPVLKSKSLYVQIGDVLPIASAIGTLLLIIYGMFRKNTIEP